MAISAAADAVRISVLFAMMLVLFAIGRRPYFKCRSCLSRFTAVARIDAEADDVDAAGAAAFVAVAAFRLACAVDDAAQRERERAFLASVGEDFGLARREFQCRGLADDNLLAALFLDRLIDGQHAHILEDGFADECFGAARFVAARQQIRRHGRPGRMNPPALVSGEISVEIARMPPGSTAAMIAGALGLDQPAFVDRFAGREGAAAIEPVRSSTAFGLLVLRIMAGPADAVGHICHFRSSGAMAWPVPMSFWATRTSTVSS